MNASWRRRRQPLHIHPRSLHEFAKSIRAGVPNAQEEHGAGRMRTFLVRVLAKPLGPNPSRELRKTTLVLYNPRLRIHKNIVCARFILRYKYDDTITANQRTKKKRLNCPENLMKTQQAYFSRLGLAFIVNVRRAISK